MNYKSILTSKEIIYLIVFTLCLIGAIVYLIPAKDKNILNIVSIISAAVTVTGFYITIKQIQSLKHISEQTDIAIKDKLIGYNKIIFLTDVTNKISLILEIKTHLREQDFKTCMMRMEEFNRTFANLSSLANLLNLEIEPKRLSVLNRNFNMDKATIEKKLNNKDYKVETEPIIFNMDKVSIYLLNIEVQLKRTSYE